jgi:endo-1,4-beta-xylanase
MNLSLSFSLRVAAALSAAAGVSGASLREAYQKQFYVGVAINRSIATGTAVKADNVDRTLGQVEQDTALVRQQFSQISPENDLKWEIVQPRPGADGYDFAPADAYVRFGMKHHLLIVGHTLVWHNQTPDWVFAGAVPAPAASSGKMYRGPRATRDELLQRMRDHIRTVVGRYRGKIKVWDVVNEAVDNDGSPAVMRNSLWLQIVGPDFIAKAFAYAHEADPDAILRYNDYNLEDSVKRHKFITLVKSLQAQHVPVMAIGTQTHVSVSSPTYAQEDQALTELEALGLPIHITELDVNAAASGQRRTGAEISQNAATTQGGLVPEADRRLTEQYVNLFQVFLRHRQSIKVVTFWGANDGVSWRAAGAPLLFDANDQPKPAFSAVIALPAHAGLPGSP